MGGSVGVLCLALMETFEHKHCQQKIAVTCCWQFFRSFFLPITRSNRQNIVISKAV